VVQGDRLVIVNKNKPAESQIGTIARILGEVDLSSVYIKPAVKKELGIIWDRLSVSPIGSGDELDFNE
jgi:rRNA processing protein Gar1